ncbi:hypothetical protein, partial [Hyphomonas sp. UBA3601]|uniref:hypothetical protein n=1 Tax=Hyphomonas sp. UBA3601 TaxID=1946626 RepID=UPI0025BB1220
MATGLAQRDCVDGAIGRQGERGIAEAWRAKANRRVIGETIGFCRNTEISTRQFAVAIYVVKQLHTVCAGLQPFEDDGISPSKTTESA